MSAKNPQENSRNAKEMKREMPLNDAPEAAPANQLPKAYDPSLIEQKWAERWASERLFDVATPDSPENLASKPFTILLPPPNVTGRLHMGHMLNQTEMDILMRWHRMLGDTALWVPGTDHAGIATQMMVERQLAAEGSSRKALGREAFEKRVWQWKEQYGSAILDQMKRLGVSVDWEREYFTMNEQLSGAVKEAFVRLWEQGLIYRGAYIVNTARGKICDRDAIVRALETGQLAGYAGDVWFPQPPPQDHPWRTMPHHGMTPHISGTSLSAQARYAAGTREILECWFEQRPIRNEYLIVQNGKLAGAGAHSYSAGDATGGSEEAAKFKKTR